MNFLCFWKSEGVTLEVWSYFVMIVRSLLHHTPNHNALYRIILPILHLSVSMKYTRLWSWQFQEHCMLAYILDKGLIQNLFPFLLHVTKIWNQVGWPYRLYMSFLIFNRILIWKTNSGFLLETLTNHLVILEILRIEIIGGSLIPFLFNVFIYLSAVMP